MATDNLLFMNIAGIYETSNDNVVKMDRNFAKFSWIIHHKIVYDPPDFDTHFVTSAEALKYLGYIITKNSIKIINYYQEQEFLGNVDDLLEMYMLYLHKIKTYWMFYEKFE